MIRKAIERKDIREVIKSIMEEYDPYYNDVYFALEWLLNESDLEGIYIYEEDGQVVDFISSQDVCGQTILYTYLLDEEKAVKEAEEISKMWNSIIVETNWSYDSIFKGWHECTFRSSVDPERRYTKPSNSSVYYTNDEKLISYFVEVIENTFFPELESIWDINFQYVTNKVKLIESIKRNPLEDYSIPMWVNTSNNYSVVGFTYFKPEDDNGKYLLAYNKDILVGIIKIGIYGSEKDKRQSVCYIDVNAAYRNRGIAKRMIYELEKHLDENLPLVLTDESEMGKICRIHQHFKDAGYSIPVYRHREFLESVYGY